jgi:hypothetical protein
MDVFSSSVERRETPTLLGPLERTNLNHWITEPVSNHGSNHWTTGPVSETLCFLVFRIPDDGQSPEMPVILKEFLFATFKKAKRYFQSHMQLTNLTVLRAIKRLEM